MQKALLEEYLKYEPDTGNFYWIKDTNSRGPSKIYQSAGTIGTLGYIQIRIFRQSFLGHRLAWLFVYGYMPDNIDHINGKPWDNRIENLRECTHARNIASAHKEALGYEIHGNKYRVRIQVDGARHDIGSFDTPEAATAAYKEARHRFLGDFA